MNKEDYLKYYIQGSDHYLIPKDIFNELFNELVNWREESKELKERINKATEYIENNATSNYFDKEKNMFRREEDLLEILKGVE